MTKTKKKYYCLLLEAEQIDKLKNDPKYVATGYEVFTNKKISDKDLERLKTFLGEGNWVRVI